MFGSEERPLSEMMVNSIRLLLEREGAGWMIKSLLANPTDQVLGRVESERVRGLTEQFRCPKVKGF